MSVAVLGTSILRSARLFLIEQALCRAYFEIEDPVLVGPDGSVDESRCKSNAMQADVSLVSGLFEVVTMVCGLIATPAYTRLIPMMGKRKILLLNLCGMTAGAVYSTAVCFFHNFFNIRMIWFTGLFDLIGGGLPVRNALLYTYIAEAVKTGFLSETLYQVSTLNLAMNFLGTALGAVLLDVDIWLLSLLGAGFGALAVPFSLGLAPSGQVEELEASSYGPLLQGEDGGENVLLTDVEDEEEELPEPKTIAQTLGAVVMEATRSSSILVDLFRDPLARATLLIYLLDETAIYVRVTLPQWAVKRFDYTLAEANAITSFSIVVNGAVLLLIPLLSRKVLRPFLGSQQLVDFGIARASLLFNIIGILCVAISPLGAFHILSLAVYSLGSGLTDSLRSLVTEAVGSDEGVRKLYMGISMVETVAGLAGTVLWSSAFSAGIRYGGTALGRIPFFAAAGLFGLGLWVMGSLGRLVSGVLDRAD
ncbi:hypothetical protein BFW01_g1791 [Lasiodiplodia theobromae]|uniref:Efflux pump ustT n=2 Tax=Lasiodiplodia theobromae TaxID=45133 RepID=A0A5N5D0J1_9PEZI|nr:Efflux pump ustT [Lasiodiplodia theobromae]KAF9630920.1 hypothetical protein BFW01_g1791 [Lasiodiplodia theobromae]